MLFFVKVIIAIIICTLIWILWSRRKFYMLAMKMPCAFGYPLIGVAHKLIKSEDIIPISGEFLNKYGPKVLTWIGPVPVFLTSDPQTCRDILTSPHCVNRAILYDTIVDFIGTGLINSKNPEWSIHRKLLNPSFSNGILQSFIRIFNDGTNELMTIFDDFKTNDELDILPIFLEHTLGVAIETTMGLKLSLTERSERKTLVEALAKLMEFITELMFKPWVRVRFNFCKMFGLPMLADKHARIIRQFMVNIVNKKMTQNDTTETRNIFVNRALELLRNGQFTWDDVVNESGVIIIGAFETTAKTLTFILIMLAMHPEHQERVFEEIESIIPDSGTCAVTNEEIQKMTYLEMFIHETMRLMPVVPLVGRQTSDEVKLSDGSVLPNGIQIGIDVFHMHRNEDLWGMEAHLFNPDNFLPANVEKRQQYAYIPFTKGIRSCIGERYAKIALKVIVSKLIRNYRFGTKFKYEDLHFIESITLKLKKMPLIMITKRN